MTSGDDLEAIEIELLLEGLYRVYGYDFRNYNRASIRRRVANRLRMDRVATVTSLLDKILHHRQEAEKLVKDFSINVTEMFRDPSFFRSFRKNAIPLLRDLPEIRIWHAGCSTGEEVVSLAILLAEEGLLAKARIYATDMNNDVLDKARKGAVPIAMMQQYTRNYLLAGGAKEFSSYYTTDCEFAYFSPQLQEQVMYFQHNLVTDYSFNEFHVILCRNVLIYFDPVLQNRVHQLFDESLDASGVLALGSKESLSFYEHADRYEAVDPAEKLYRKGKP